MVVGGENLKRGLSFKGIHREYIGHKYIFAFVLILLRMADGSELGGAKDSHGVYERFAHQASQFGYFFKNVFFHQNRSTFRK